MREHQAAVWISLPDNTLYFRRLFIEGFPLGATISELLGSQ